MTAPISIFDKLFSFFDVANGPDTSLRVVSEYTDFFGMTDRQLISLLSDPEWQPDNKLHHQHLEGAQVGRPFISFPWKEANPLAYSEILRRFYWYQLMESKGATPVEIYFSSSNWSSSDPHVYASSDAVTTNPDEYNIRVSAIDVHKENNVSQPCYLVTFGTKEYSGTFSPKELTIITDLARLVKHCEKRPAFYFTNIFTFFKGHTPCMFKIIGGAILEDLAMEEMFIDSLELPKDTMNEYVSDWSNVSTGIQYGNSKVTGDWETPRKPLRLSSDHARGVVNNLHNSINLIIQESLQDKYLTSSPSALKKLEIITELYKKIKNYPTMWAYANCRMEAEMKNLTSNVGAKAIAIYQQVGLDLLWPGVPINFFAHGEKFIAVPGNTIDFTNFKAFLVKVINQRNYWKPERYHISTLTVESFLYRLVERALGFHGGEMMRWYAKKFLHRMNSTRIVAKIVKIMKKHATFRLVNSNGFEALAGVALDIPELGENHEFLELIDEHSYRTWYHKRLSVSSKIDWDVSVYSRVPEEPQVVGESDDCYDV